MEKKDLKIQLPLSGSGSVSPRISLPPDWIVNQWGMTLDNRNVEVTFDGESIVIKPKKKELTRKEINQEIYRQTKKASSGNTATCLEFLKYLRDADKGIEDLLDMEGLNIVEKEYIRQLIDGDI